MRKWLGPLLVVTLAVLAELSLGRVSHAPDLALFFGRFHPLIVHLPIGFFLLVVMGEVATFHPTLRGRVEPALGLLVPVAALAALAAFLMGQLLALEGGFPSGALGWHRRLTLLAVMGMSVCWVLFARQRDGNGQGRWTYRGVLGVTLGLLSLGAHFGGTMTRGDSYLSKYAPGPLKPLLGAPEAKKEPASASAAPPADPLVYRDVLQPLLTKYCVDCHGSEKQKGKLRLDSLERLMAGGEDGAVIVAGTPSKSTLVTRMLLPVSDDDHMPPKDEPVPPPEAIALIQFWIERGASPTLRVGDALPPAASRALLEHTLNGASPSDSVPVSAPGASAHAAVPPVSLAASDSAVPGVAAPLAKAPAHAAAKPDAFASGNDPADSAAASPALAAPTAVASSGPEFLAAHCEKCHGAAKQKGKLRVDSVAALVKGGADGTALVPGSPDQSSIVKRVRLALSDEDHMPPKKEPQPSAAEVSALVAWIRSGVGTAARAESTSPIAAKTTAATSVSDTASASAAAPAAATASASDTTSAADTTPSSATERTTDAAPSSAAERASTSAVTPSSAPPEHELLASLPPKVTLFADAVQPLFREKCGKCHIKDKPAGGLGVDQYAQLIEGGYSGPGVVPQDRRASVVMQRIVLAPSDDDHMPPEGEPALSADEVELIGAWIDRGAPARDSTATAKLTSGAVRALAAHGVKASPQPLAARAGGCAACSVPGAPQSKWATLQALALAAGAAVLATRRQQRRAA